MEACFGIMSEVAIFSIQNSESKAKEEAIMHKTTKRPKYDLYGDLENIKSAFSDAADGIRGRAASALYDKWDDARERTQEVQDNVSGVIKKRPLASVLTALLAGALIGRLFH